MTMNLLLNIALCFCLSACLFADVGIELGKEFTIKKGETAAASGGDLKLRMLRAGRSQQQHGGDSIFCTADIAYGGEHHEVTLDVGETATAGGKTIKLTKVDLTASPQAKDPWETNSCSYIVTKVEK